MSTPLLGKKIGVLVESLYIPDEIAAYQQDFATLGAEVHLMSRLWEKPSQTFSSDPDGTDHIQKLVVSIDFQKVRLEDYAAIIMAANYTSVRLRYFQPPEEPQPQDAPAVKFFARAMSNPNIVKGALCHGLWILTPRPQLLRGRRVICHEVVMADVLNAEAILTSSPTKVVVDNDLVTGHSKNEVHTFIQVIAEQIQKISLIHA